MLQLERRGAQTFKRGDGASWPQRYARGSISGGGAQQVTHWQLSVVSTGRLEVFIERLGRQNAAAQKGAGPAERAANASFLQTALRRSGARGCGRQFPGAACPGCGC